MKKIYLDYAATTPVDPKVLAAMEPYFFEKFGNASSLHAYGQEAKKGLEDSRQTLADSIGAKPEEIVFTSGGTEADNFALLGVAYALEKKVTILLLRLLSTTRLANQQNSWRRKVLK